MGYHYGRTTPIRVLVNAAAMVEIFSRTVSDRMSRWWVLDGKLSDDVFIIVHCININIRTMHFTHFIISSFRSSSCFATDSYQNIMSIIRRRPPLPIWSRVESIRIEIAIWLMASMWFTVKSLLVTSNAETKSRMATAHCIAANNSRQQLLLIVNYRLSIGTIVYYPPLFRSP